MREFFMNVVKQ